MIKLLIADDHYIVRAGLKKILGKERDIILKGEAENASEIFAFLETEIVDLIILDINMPGNIGLDALKKIKELWPKVKVLVLSIYPEDSYAINAFKFGASGYLTKDSSPKELVKAVRKIYDGRKYVSEQMAEKLASRIEITQKEYPHNRLSQREMEVLLLISQGKTPSEMAHKLNLSINTIATYRTRILDKMEMNSNAALIHYVVKNNLLE